MKGLNATGNNLLGKFKFLQDPTKFAEKGNFGIQCISRFQTGVKTIPTNSEESQFSKERMNRMMFGSKRYRAKVKAVHKLERINVLESYIVKKRLRRMMETSLKR